MKAVTLPLKLARELRDFVDGGERRDHARLLAALDSAIKASKPGQGVTAARKAAKAKKATRREVWADIREAVIKRAGGVCECGIKNQQVIHGHLEVDHFFGGSNRRALESVETCWALGSICHGRKTANKPTGAYWLELFVAHCWRRMMDTADPSVWDRYDVAKEMAAGRLPSSSLPMGARHG